MKINKNIRYGLRAIVEIAKSHEPVLQKEIAERQEISLYYLDSIISGLRNAGLIINSGGKSSGYVLAKKTNEITIYQVYRAFNPELQIVDCNCGAQECKRLKDCPVKNYWCELNSKFKEIMKNKTIEDILNN